MVQTSRLLTEGGERSVSGDGACIQNDELTGTSDTSGTTFLAAGEYDIRHMMWERGGGEHAEVFTSIGDNATDVAARQLLGVDAVMIDTNIAAGLQLTGVPVIIDTCDPNSQGDLDGNGMVEFADFLILSGNFGLEVADHTAGDIDCSGTVDFADFLALSANFGQAVGAAESVPEPSSFVLLGLASLALGSLRRRR